ncbi:MAG TPA: HNH endonuclease [bacterium]|nr:HNH endonuclease [bacterium]
MSRRKDCIYCGDDVGSREHTFPAALGGRRMNKGILCKNCNNSFSNLDNLLAQQLAIFNGLIGVRHDRAEKPKPFYIESKYGPITIDNAGTPVMAEPKIISDQERPDGGRLMTVRFGSEQQVRQWYARQRDAGYKVKRINSSEGRRFLDEPLPVSWKFGGTDAFREIGRIALNFLAYYMPDLARRAELKPFKEFVLGKSLLQKDKLTPVWFSPPTAFILPDSRFSFGHQVIILSDDISTFARVRLFSSLDFFVCFGQLLGAPSAAVVFDIDPLAENPPNDLVMTELLRSEFPTVKTLPMCSNKDYVELLGTQLKSLMGRIGDRQWMISTQSLLRDLNATRGLSSRMRKARVAELLEPQSTRILNLARYVLKKRQQAVEDEPSRMLAEITEAILASDPESEDGLSSVARAVLAYLQLGLSRAVAKELETCPLTDEKLRTLLEGNEGIDIVSKQLHQIVILSLKGKI